ncbi:MAG TPA: ribosomal protein S18-alanine N-acetyltransferase [Allosphingosinicella sp.]|jgi:ribosomal-protein-alanine N-acetyltransferase
MSDAVELADGALSDLPAVMAVMQAAFEPRFGEGWTAAQCAGLLPLPGVWLTVARAGGDTVGFALSRVVLDEAELLLLAVKPDARRRGVGKSLLDHFIATAIIRGAQRVHLEVREGNSAVKLYRTSGFTLAGRRRRYYTGPDGALYDALSLSRRAVSSPSD